MRWYTLGVSKREKPQVTGKDAERFLKNALKNQKIKEDTKYYVWEL